MDSVTFECGNGVAVITINRPDHRNAVSVEVAEGIAASVDEFEARQDLSVAILTGAGGNFCAGLDLKGFARGEIPVIDGRGFAGLTERPPTKPLIAAVEGWALAGGFELALSADLVVAASDSRFGIPEVKRGLVAGGGGLLRLPKVLPYHLAMQLALTGDPISAEIAHRHGLINVLTAPGMALEGARSLATQIAGNGPLAVQLSKRILSQAVGHSSSQAFEDQAGLVARAMSSADALEGARAFAEKRPPVWVGA
jgi:enoyl-CoA hydratase